MFPFSELSILKLSTKEIIISILLVSTLVVLFLHITSLTFPFKSGIIISEGELKDISLMLSVDELSYASRPFDPFPHEYKTP